MRLMLTNKLLGIIFLIFTLNTGSIKCNADEIDYDALAETDAGIIPFTHLCNFDRPMLNHSVAHDEDFCNCDVVPSALIGRPSVKINCEMSDNVKNLTNSVFQAQKLPKNTISLILSYQHFTEIPEFSGDHLTHLDMSNNLITIVKSSNFIRITSLEHLDLSYNSISNIEAEAFSQLQLLHYLDLSSNQLVVLPANVFAPLITLETLKLSSNVGFGKIMGRDVVNSSLTSLYLHLSVTPKLKNLDMERCELHQLNLRQGTGLKSINLSFNNITDFSTIQLPDGVESLKLSGNPIRYFVAKSLPHLNELRELILQDLPNLGTVDEYSLYGFPKLNHLTFEGSKNLSTLHAHAFGTNVVDDEIDLSLKILNLRGCHLRTLDSSLDTVLDKLDEFHLDGNPFNCDCHIKWIKYLNVETNLRCYKPQAHLNKLLSEVPDNKLKCENMFMKKLLNTMILLFLLIACSLAIWFFLRRLNPSRRNKLQKVGPDSPYSPYHRVTIDPNRAEYSMY